MSRYIDADKLVELCDEMSRINWNQRVSPVSWADAYESFIDDIDEQPTVEVVEVVRCKDCHFWKERWHNPIVNQLWGECHQFRDERENYYETEANDYCSYGERKEDGK
jgi:hypothetical protein